MRAESRWTDTGIPRVQMVRSEGCADQVYEPMLHLVLQGHKSLSIGEQNLRFDEASYFVVPVHVPATGEVQPDGAAPYLAVSLKLDPTIIASLMAEMHGAGSTPHPTGFAVSAASPELIDAWLRMLRLIGPQGDKLREVACADSRLAQVRPAIDWIRDNFAKAIHAERLAGMTGMSVAAFYRHFKAVTSMAPIQYQKSLRLLKARRLLLFETHDVGKIAYAVGDESASQFSREYARMFGLPPGRDAARFKVAAPTEDGALAAE